MQPALELRGIVKRFGDCIAVDRVSLSVNPGEVVALVGENGAGKSTLIHVACGLYAGDAGEVRAFGRELPAGDARAAIEAGIGVVFQDLMLVGPLRVWENVVLGREPRTFRLLDAARAKLEVAQVAGQLGFAIDVDARVEELSLAAQQRVEIVKQIWRGARVLALDEPTAVLAPAEIDELLATVRTLARAGRSALFVSHKLPEVLAVADRVAVLRRGQLVEVVNASDTDAHRLARAMMGADPTPDILTDLGVPGEPRLVVRDLRCGRLRGVSFALRAGEIVGVAGVDGNGQSELAEALTGLRRATGEMLLDGDDGLRSGGWGRTAAAARARGVVHIPEDRRRGLCLSMSVEENLALGRDRTEPYARGARIDVDGRRTTAAELIAAFDVRPSDPRARAAELSGGNQQKVVAARELRGGAPPRLVVAMQPTRGLDVRAARRLHESLREARAGGAAVLLVSLDLDELRSLSDRLLVLSDGRIAGEIASRAPVEIIGQLMLAHGTPRA